MWQSEEEEIKQKELEKLIELVDKNFTVKWYDALKFFPLAVVFFELVFVSIMLFFYLLIAPLSEKFALILVFFTLAISFYQLVTSLPHFVEVVLVDRFFKKVGVCVEEEKKPLLKALIVMRYRQRQFRLSEIYKIQRSLFESEKLLSILYE